MGVDQGALWMWSSLCMGALGISLCVTRSRAVDRNTVSDPIDQRISAVLCYLMFIGDFFLGIARSGSQMHVNGMNEVNEEENTTGWL